uniref:Proteasome subunit beta n=1 Tax=Esox lucius TaxID=8010 RepID=A0AAY5JWZ5_ESOLU
MFATQVHGDNGKMKEYHYTGPVEHRFSPYSFNGGTVLAVAGEDFAIVASDTRLSEGYSIHSRDSPKCYKLTDTTVIGCSGFHGDCLTLTKIIDARLKMYKHSNNKSMTSGAIAAMLSTILYGRRFFPYYVYNIIGGLDEEGRGAVYSFDPVGSYQRDTYKAGGSASAMLQPLLDNQVTKLFGISSASLIVSPLFSHFNGKPTLLCTLFACSTHKWLNLWRDVTWVGCLPNLFLQ